MLWQLMTHKDISNLKKIKLNASMIKPLGLKGKTRHINLFLKILAQEEQHTAISSA